MARAKRKTSPAGKSGRARGRQRTMDDRIEDLRAKLAELERRKTAKEIASQPIYRHLRSVRRALAKAVALMDGRKTRLDADFLRASRQYFHLLERALDEVAGQKRRGRKPKTDLGVPAS